MPYLLKAMTAGRAGEPKKNTPSFPEDGRWNLRWVNPHPASKPAPNQATQKTPSEILDRSNGVPGWRHDHFYPLRAQ